MTVHLLLSAPFSWSDDTMEEALVRVEGRNLHVVPVQTRVPQVRLALQEGGRPLHPLTEVVVVITERSCMLIPHPDFDEKTQKEDEKKMIE